MPRSDIKSNQRMLHIKGNSLDCGRLQERETRFVGGLVLGADPHTWSPSGGGNISFAQFKKELKTGKINVAKLRRDAKARMAKKGYQKGEGFFDLLKEMWNLFRMNKDEYVAQANREREFKERLDSVMNRKPVPREPEPEGDGEHPLSKLADSIFEQRAKRRREEEEREKKRKAEQSWYEWATGQGGDMDADIARVKRGIHEAKAPIRGAQEFGREATKGFHKAADEEWFIGLLRKLGRKAFDALMKNRQ